MTGEVADQSPMEGEVPRYDLRGLNCPLPVLKARKRLAGMSPGSLLWLETTDPLAALDIPAFCGQEGHRLVESRRRDGGHDFLVARGDSPRAE